MDNNRKKRFVLNAVNEGYSLDEISGFLSQQSSQSSGLNLNPAPLANEPMDVKFTSAGGLLSQKGPITQKFGNYNPKIEKYSGGVNYGVDIGVPEGTDVTLPPGEWQVVEASRNGNFNRGYGNSVLVKNTKTNEKLRFSHLSRVASLSPDQKLSGGATFAKTGATGNVTGAHLDLEYYDKLNRVQDFLKSSYAGGL